MRTNEQKLIRSCCIFDIFRVRNNSTAQKQNTAWTASAFHAYPSCDCMVFKVGGNLLHGSWQTSRWIHQWFKWRPMTMLSIMCRCESPYASFTGKMPMRWVGTWKRQNMPRKHHSSAAKICYVDTFFLCVVASAALSVAPTPMMKCPGSVSLALGKSWKGPSLTSLDIYVCYMFCKSFGCQKLKTSASHPHELFLMPRLKDLNVDYAQHCFLRASSLDVT